MLVNGIQMCMYTMSQTLSLKFSLDLFVYMQLQWICLSIFLHFIYQQLRWMQQDRIIVKSPGKVMLAGGYAVLEQGNLGLTLAVDRYFFSISSKIKTQVNITSTHVSIESPQIGLTWSYIFTPKDHSIKENSNKVNVFLENAVKYSLIYVFTHSSSLLNDSIHIIILQDRGFLSQPQQLPQSGNRFISYSQQSTKTGLGSSAGVIVVTVSAILRQMIGNNIPRETINVVSQVANLAAQNKIGSNFDISTAVFGSHLYHNLLPRQAFKASNTLHFHDVQKIDPQVQSLEVKCEKIRKGYCCMLDLKKGSNTRKMVSGFIKTLNEQSPQIISDFYRISKVTVQQIYKLLVQEQSEEVLIPQIKQINLQYRQFLQRYSAITSIPVEPSQLSPFLDHICKIALIIYAICPGSGGYDAIFLLSTAQTQQQIATLKNQLKQVCTFHKVQADINDTNILWGQPKTQQDDILSINKYLKL